MPDYYTQNAAPTGAVAGTGLLGLRKDSPADIAAANLNFTYPQFDSGGAIRCTEEGGKASYLCSAQFACDSTATDIWTLPGNASTTVKVLWLLITSVATAAATGRLQVVLRTVADTAGTRVVDTAVAMDSRDAAASSIPGHYTVHPSALGAGTAILSLQFGQQAVNSIPIAAPFFLDFRTFYGGKALRLAGVSQILAVNAAAALGASGNAWDITVAWTEEPTSA